MDTGIALVDDDSIEAVIVSSPIPMETELEEIVNINSTGDSASHCFHRNQSQCTVTTLRVAVNTHSH